MAHSRFCKMCNGWHDLDESWPMECVPEPAARSALPAPRIMSDNIEIQSMLDGKVYTSKAQLRGTYRSAGVEEIGNEKPKAPQKVTPDRREIRKALHEVASQYR